MDGEGIDMVYQILCCSNFMDPLFPLSSREFSQTLSLISRRYKEYKNEVIEAKELYADYQSNAISEAKAHVSDLAQSIQDAYQSLKQVEHPETFLTKLVQLDRKVRLLDQTATLIDVAEKETPGDLYEKLNATMGTLLFVMNPANMLDEKIKKLLNNYEDLVALAGDSPKRVALLLLRLLKISYETLLRELPNQHEQHDVLQGILEDINERFIDKEKRTHDFTPRYEKSLNVAPVGNVVLSDLAYIQKQCRSLNKTVVLVKPFSFFACCRRKSITLLKGEELSEEFGKLLPGLIKRLKKLFTKVIAGNISPGQSEELSQKIDTYASIYNSLRERLRARREEVFALSPDETFVNLLKYVSKLRFMLSEVAIHIDQLRKHSSCETLTLLRSIKKVVKNPAGQSARELLEKASIR